MEEVEVSQVQVQVQVQVSRCTGEKFLFYVVEKVSTRRLSQSVKLKAVVGRRYTLGESQSL